MKFVTAFGALLISASAIAGDLHPIVEENRIGSRRERYQIRSSRGPRR
jgi:hypothetical protein